jgi:uncharacterized alpha-E superfamily protein
MRPSGTLNFQAEGRDSGMLSRVADNLYWMSRYLERAEHTARLVDVELELWLDQARRAGAERWRFLLEALQAAPAGDSPVGATSLVETLVFNRSRPSSLVSSIASARENLRHVREQCSSEMWEQLNRLYLGVMEEQIDEARNLKSHAFLRGVRDGTHLFQGITDGTMSHGEGWQYIQLGRYVERTVTLALLIGAHFARLPHAPDQAVETAEYLEWIGLLKGCGAFESYCKAYTAEIRPVQVAEFLLLDPDFPHSVRFSVDCMETSLKTIADLTDRKAGMPARIAGRLRAQLSFSDIDEILSAGAPQFLQSVSRDCAELHAAIHQIYFDYPVEAELAS